MGRRAAGEGSIHQRSRHGKWCAVLDLGYVKGKRVRRTRTTDTQEEAGRRGPDAGLCAGLRASGALLWGGTDLVDSEVPRCSAHCGEGALPFGSSSQLILQPSSRDPLEGPGLSRLQRVIL